MSDLISALNDYVADTECPERNYRLALLYRGMGHTAAALTFYLRTAERTDDPDLSYECLLVMGLCFAAQGNRENSERGMYKRAMMLLPNRPEAYFLLARSYERSRLYADGYLMAELGMRMSDGHQHKPLRGYVEYPGDYGLLFEKAVTSWWWGKEMESRKLFRQLSREYHTTMDNVHRAAVYRNLAFLGIGPEGMTHKSYRKEDFARLRRQFTGAEQLWINHAQVYQDLFVLMCLNGKKGGKYLEIGSAGPFYGNNTALLETQFQWTGNGIEFQQSLCEEYAKNRKNSIHCRNALDITPKEWDEFFDNNDIDYISLDCDPPNITYEILTKLPLNKYKAAVITYEHDAYCDETQSFAEKSRSYLKSLGYTLVVANVSPEGESAFEDWWVHPDLIDPQILTRMMPVNPPDIMPIYEYMFPEFAEIPNFDWGEISKNAWFRNVIHKEIFVDRVYERFVKPESGDIVVDVGASVGPFLRSITENRSFSKLYAFEPHPRLTPTLHRNLQDLDVTIYSSAIGENTGEEAISGIFNPNEIHCSNSSKQTVSTMSFRDFVAKENLSKIDFLKVDCEGGEYDIFTDANFDWITSNVRKISGEFHLTSPEQKAKFRKFRDTYLRHFHDFWVESMDYVDIKWSVWDEWFLEHYSCVSIHIDNRFPYWKHTQIPTLEINTAIPAKGCVVDCAYCPQKTLTKAYKSPTRILTLDNFQRVLDKVPNSVRITFSAFVEPWMNKYCTDMVEYAHGKGHPIAVFTTGVGMNVEDVQRLSRIPYDSGPNGGFVLHLPDQERIAKHPINPNYVRVIEEFAKHKFSSFSTMCMTNTVHESVRHVYPTAYTPDFWHRAGNLVGEGQYNPETAKLFTQGKFKTITHDGDRTCGCQEHLYHNILLPNGDVSLCCMDYGLESILGNLFESDYTSILPKPRSCFDLCRRCENGVIA